MQWARRTSTQPGPKAPPCPLRKRSPTPCAGAVNANGRPAAGHRSPRPSATSCDWSAKDSPTTTLPQGFSSHRAPCKRTSRTSTPNSALPPAYNSRKKQRATPDPSRRSIAEHLCSQTTFSNWRQVQAPCKIGPADNSNEVGITAHDELVAGAGQADVETFPGAFEGRLLVDDEHDRASLEPLEAEDVAVEHLLRIPEAVPVGGVAGGLAFRLLGVATAGGQQRDILWAPALVEEQFDLIVTLVHRVGAGAGDEFHGAPL